MAKKKIIAFAATLVAAVTLTGCSLGANDRDLEGIHYKDPDKIEVYINIDQHPNIARICIAGVAFATTSRDYSALTRIPEWDSWCAQ